MYINGLFFEFEELTRFKVSHKSFKVSHEAFDRCLWQPINDDSEDADIVCFRSVSHQTEEQGMLYQVSALLNESMDREELARSLECLSRICAIRRHTLIILYIIYYILYINTLEINCQLFFTIRIAKCIVILSNNKYCHITAYNLR